MKNVPAQVLALASLALASCGASPIHSLDQAQDHAASPTLSNSCASVVLMPEAKNACSCVVASSFSGIAQLTVVANGPDVWPAAITVELSDADRDFAGPLCTLTFVANGSQACGTFVLREHDVFAVDVTVPTDRPTGVRLTLESVSE